MAKIDRLKEEVGWLKVVFGVLVAIDVSVLGWLAQNYPTASRLLVLGATALGQLCDCAREPIGVSSNQATGGRVMVWFVIAALAAFAIALILVVRDAERLSR
jgi:hypothetical protein